MTMQAKTVSYAEFAALPDSFNAKTVQDADLVKFDTGFMVRKTGDTYELPFGKCEIGVVVDASKHTDPNAIMVIGFDGSDDGENWKEGYFEGGTRPGGPCFDGPKYQIDYFHSISTFDNQSPNDSPTFVRPFVEVYYGKVDFPEMKSWVRSLK